MSWPRLSCGILIAVLACTGACGGSKTNGRDGGGGAAGSGGRGGAAGSGGRGGAGGSGGSGGAAAGSGGSGGTASVDAGSNTDAPNDGPAGETNACPVDGAVVADPFAGVWTGVQGNETFTFTNSGGCSSWTGSSGATICDRCTGTYVQTAAGVASATLQCQPVGACSVSAAHTDTGQFKLSGCSITYDYDYGGGTNTFTGTRVADTTVNVCGQLDGGSDGPSDASNGNDGAGCGPEPLAFPVVGCNNVAAAGTASASATGDVDGQVRVPAYALDGLRCTNWNAGGFAPQWWQVDFNQSRNVRGITVVPAMFPSTGDVVHDVQVSSDGVTFTTKLTISQSMTSGTSYSFDFGGSVSARYVRIQSTSSPSWISWHDVAVFECP